MPLDACLCAQMPTHGCFAFRCLASLSFSNFSQYRDINCDVCEADCMACPICEHGTSQPTAGEPDDIDRTSQGLLDLSTTSLTRPRSSSNTVSMSALPFVMAAHHKLLALDERSAYNQSPSHGFWTLSNLPRSSLLFINYSVYFICRFNCLCLGPSALSFAANICWSLSYHCVWSKTLPFSVPYSIISIFCSSQTDGKHLPWYVTY